MCQMNFVSYGPQLYFIYVVSYFLQNADGDTFDCVNINKQPAFDHPLLKNHTIQMRPTNFPEGVFDEVTQRAMSPKVGLMDETCPIGTIPIMRNKMENIQTAKSVTSPKFEHYISTTKGVVSFAEIILRTGEYYGSTAELNVYGPQVSANQSSSSAIRLINEGDGLGPVEQVEINSIVAGWTVSPPLYGDNKTRLFTYWTADGYQKTGCYNLLCPGFVQVSTDISLGYITAHYQFSMDHNMLLEFSYLRIQKLKIGGW